MKKTHKVRIFLIVILIFNVLLRLPSLFDPVSYGDECIYLTLGNALNQGAVFYRDIHDNKPPLLYLMAAIAGGKLFWLRLLSIIWNTINVFLVYKLGRLLNRKVNPALWAAGLFALFSLLPEGRVANGEIFMIMPATLALLVAFKAIKAKKDWLWLVVGLLFSLGFLFKIPIAFDFIGFVLAMFIFKQKNLKKSLVVFKDKKIYLAVLGFIAPIFLSLVYYTGQGAFTPYFRSALLQNVGYLSSWGGSNAGLYWRGLILLFVTVWIYHWRQKLGPNFLLYSLMTAFGLYGVFLSQRPYPHYLIEIAPWAALLFTVLLSQRKKAQLVVFLTLVFLGVLGCKKYQFWWYPHLPYYHSFLKFATGKMSKNEFFSEFGGKVLNDYSVAKYIKTRTQEKDPVFIWGDGACIYALSQRLPPGRYTVNYHIYDFDGFKETLKAIEKKPPKVMVILEPIDRRLSELETLLQLEYIKTAQIGNAAIYQGPID